MSDTVYRDADHDAAQLGKKRRQLARWWRPMLGVFVSGTSAFGTLLCANGLKFVDVHQFYPWGLMLIISSMCIAVPAAPLLIMMPFDLYWDNRMQEAFRRRNNASRTL